MKEIVMNTYRSDVLKRTVAVLLMALMFLGSFAMLEPGTYADGEPAAVRNLKWVSGFNSVILTWKGVSASGYEVRQGSKVLRTNLTQTRVRISMDPYPTSSKGNVRTASYSVYAFNVIDGAKVYSAPATVKNVSPVHPMYIIVQTRGKTKLYPNATSNKSVRTAKGGQKLVVMGGSRQDGRNKRMVIQIGGKQYYVKAGDVKVLKMLYNSKTKYNKTNVESFINDKNLDSKPVSGPKRMIWVNTYNQRVYLFARKGGKWVIDSRYPNGLLANTGRELTPYGVYKVSTKWRRKEETGTNWWTILGGTGVGIHEKLGDALGKPASGGCIRIPDSEARWFYYNIKRRTTVMVY